MKVYLIGNNLSSLILAYILSQKNLNVVIYSVKSSTYNFKTRTLGLTSFNYNYLKNYFNNLSKKIHSINEIKVLIQNEKVNKEIFFNKNLIPLFHMIKYNDLISLIKSKIKNKKNISFKYIKEETNLLNLIDKKKSELIINCESSNILTRRFLKNVVHKNYYNKAFTTLINHKKIKNNKAIQIFTKYGPIAFLPLSNELTSIVFSFELKKKKKINEKEIWDIIKRYNSLYTILSYEKIQSFNLNFRLPKKYYYKNILFFGDSLHSIHPLAGQGFNMTVRDIIKFIEILNKKIDLGLSIDNSISKEFEKAIKSYNSIFSFGVDFIYEFFRFNKNVVPKNISEKIFDYIGENKKLKNLSIKIANYGYF